tara:strand:- start:2742 stop:3320 length:579 start_codon:yes stop_codon:yes gene_type:complete
MKKKIIIIGAGGHAKSCIDVIENQGKYNIYGIIDKGDKKKLLNYKILGNEKILPSIRKKIDYAFIAIGHLRDNSVRRKIQKLLKKYSFKLPIIVSKKAHISKNSKIGEGTIVMHNCLVNSCARIGKNCIINSGAVIEHDSIIEDNVHVSTNSTVNGSVLVGQNSFIGSGSVIKQNIRIKKNSIVQANSFVKK